MGFSTATFSPALDPERTRPKVVAKRTRAKEFFIPVEI
jgi:hypothetical protein